MSASLKPKTLTEPQAATQIGISAGMLAKMRRAGKVPSWRQVGRRVLYLPEDVERFLAAQRRGQVAESISEGRVLEARFG